MINNTTYRIKMPDTPTGLHRKTPRFSTTIHNNLYTLAACQIIEFLQASSLVDVSVRPKLNLQILHSWPLILENRLPIELCCSRFDFQVASCDRPYTYRPYSARAQVLLCGCSCRFQIHPNDFYRSHKITAYRRPTTSSSC